MSENKTQALKPYLALAKEMDEELFNKIMEWRQCVYANKVIPRKYRELMMVAMCCTVQASVGIRNHAQNALDFGATKEELFATVAQSMLVGGFPGFREGITAISDLLKPTPGKD